MSTWYKDLTDADFALFNLHVLELYAVASDRQSLRQGSLAQISVVFDCRGCSISQLGCAAPASARGLASVRCPARAARPARRGPPCVAPLGGVLAQRAQQRVRQCTGTRRRHAMYCATAADGRPRPLLPHCAQPKARRANQAHTAHSGQILSRAGGADLRGQRAHGSVHLMECREALSQ